MSSHLLFRETTPLRAVDDCVAAEGAHLIAGIAALGYETLEGCEYGTPNCRNDQESVPSPDRNDREICGAVLVKS